MELLAFADLFKFILAGAAVGFAVGLTGVGGGSLMTPLLIMFNFPTHIAIGTDLIYAAVTKSSGVISHARQSTVNWQIVFNLSIGSIPASVATVYCLKNVFGAPDTYQDILQTSLGFMLILTSVVIILRPKLQRSFGLSNSEQSLLKKHQGKLTTLTGILLGIFVTLTSVGAGAFGAAVLMVLYPRLNSVTIIGTDIAHAVPLTLIAGIGHMQLGSVDFTLLVSLLIGSLPAIHFGTKLSKKLPNHLLQPILASILFMIGVRYAFF